MPPPAIASTASPLRAPLSAHLRASAPPRARVRRPTPTIRAKVSIFCPHDRAGVARALQIRGDERFFEQGETSVRMGVAGSGPVVTNRFESSAGPMMGPAVWPLFLDKVAPRRKDQE